MAGSQTPKLGFWYAYPLGEDGWNTGYDANWRKMDALVQPTVEDKDLATPPGSPANGDCYIVPSSPTGAWVGQTGKIARWNGASWEFFAPKKGWQFYVADEDAAYKYSGTAWVISGSGGGGGGDRNAVSALSIASGAVGINCSLGDYFTLTLTENVSAISFSNLPGSGKGASLMLHITQGATPRSVVWPATFRWEGSPAAVSTAANAVDLLAITTFDNGSTWHATLSKGRA